MLDWSPGAVRATVGVGGLGFTFYVWFLLEPLLHLDVDYWPILLIAFLPTLIFFFATPDMLPVKIILPAQWMAIIWYFLLTALSVCVAVYRGLMAIDALLAVFILIGAWPCLLAARRLRAAAKD
ncbi:MAG TPA: hypothetical protein VGP08_03075 [Pyrinomonadaceae bacterium]|jgi:hypothetical protein|nr:hypothetical protein [Pyrinomonadaceae bacterium]